MDASLVYSEFVEMFEVGDKFADYKHETDGGAQIEVVWKYTESRNRFKCAFLWKPSSEEWNGMWIRKEYDGSSSFAMWWCNVAEGEED